MNKRTTKLLDELKKQKPSCYCGAVSYPRCWMTKTREQAVKDGVLFQCSCIGAHPIYVSLKLKD
jgi:hypothetical protein